MTVYVDVVMALNFLVDWLLLIAANRIDGYPALGRRCALAAALGAVYAAACLLWPLSGWHEGVLHLLCLAGMSAIAYGVQLSALRRVCIFVILSMALGGAEQVMQMQSVAGLVLCAAGLFVVAAMGVLRVRTGRILPVELRYGAKTLKIFALQDTGNCLTDPISGQSVLIIGSKYAQELTGLSAQQLHDPVQAMGVIPGLRLIPYKTVGQGGDFLLGLRLDEVKIGKCKGGRLVAFAKEDFQDGYQALTGGGL